VIQRRENRQEPNPFKWQTALIDGQQKESPTSWQDVGDFCRWQFGNTNAFASAAAALPLCQMPKQSESAKADFLISLVDTPVTAKTTPPVTSPLLGAIYFGLRFDCCFPQNTFRHFLLCSQFSCGRTV